MLVQFMLVPLGMLTTSRWLLHPFTCSLRCIIALVKNFACEYQIDFNPTYAKLICFNANIDHTPHVILTGQPISVVFKDKHLGNNPPVL